MTREMGAHAPVSVSSLADDLSFPRKNGEPVFEEPWQARVFGLVVSLWQAGAFKWDDFKALLIDEVERGSCKGDVPSSYYEQFANAFWRLAQEKGLLQEAELLGRAKDFEDGTRDDHRHDGHGHVYDHHHGAHVH